MISFPYELFLLDLDLTSLSGMALQYGPFFFSMLFLYGISRWAHKRYRESLVLPEHTPRLDEAIKLDRNVYFASFLFGILLTVASVIWWWHYRPSSYIFQGTICYLKHSEYVSSPILFQRKQPRESMHGDPEVYRDEKFVVIQDHPFTTNQRFEVDYTRPGDTAQHQLWIPYPGDNINDISYSIKFDQGRQVITQNAELITINLGQPASNVIYAQELQESIDMAKPTIASLPIATTFSPYESQNSPASILASSTSSIGAKLSALRTLPILPQGGAWAWGDLSSEPELVTLLDLSRYRDDELAYFARDYLERINISAIVVQLLSNQSTFSIGQQIFMHLDDNSCSIVLEWLRSASSPLYASLKEIGNPLQLVGTPSPNGDRYYVRAVWNPSDKDSVKCLAKAFNEELVSNRSLHDEVQLMQSRNTRLVYWYGKNWPMHIRDRIIGCGGQATFTSPVSTTSGKDN